MSSQLLIIRPLGTRGLADIEKWPKIEYLDKVHNLLGFPFFTHQNWTNKEDSRIVSTLAYSELLPIRVLIFGIPPFIT